MVHGYWSPLSIALGVVPRIGGARRHAHPPDPFVSPQFTPQSSTDPSVSDRSVSQRLARRAITRRQALKTRVVWRGRRASLDARQRPPALHRKPHLRGSGPPGDAGLGPGKPLWRSHQAVERASQAKPGTVSRGLWVSADCVGGLGLEVADCDFKRRARWTRIGFRAASD